MSVHEDQARRYLAACAKAGVEPWRPGMRITIDGHRGLRLVATDLAPPVRLVATVEVTSRTILYVDAGEGWLPDFSDPATLGCLLAVVREAWGDPAASVVIDADGTATCYLTSGHQFTGPTEIDALIAAIEAAPRRER